jgi:hypothetical protein
MSARKRGRGGSPRHRATEAPTIAVLPMALEVGDRFVDEEGEWEVVSGPSTLREGHAVHARVQRPDDPGSAKDVSWPAHERLTVARSRGARE